MEEFYIKGFLSPDQKTVLILKSMKIGYDVGIIEYGAGTFLTFTKANNAIVSSSVG